MVFGKAFCPSPAIMVVTMNCSPAPSQSLAVMIGVCTYTKPRSRKNSCVAWASAERTLDTAPIVFVRGRRCAIPRRNSREWRFFCRGYVPPSHEPTTFSSEALSSIFCLPPGDSTISPLTATAVPVPTSPLFSKSHPSQVSFTTACRPATVLPSLISTNPNVFCTRLVRTQPRTTTVLPTKSRPSSGLFLICAILLREKKSPWLVAVACSSSVDTSAELVTVARHALATKRCSRAGLRLSSTTEDTDTELGFSGLPRKWTCAWEMPPLPLVNEEGVTTEAAIPPRCARGFRRRAMEAAAGGSGCVRDANLLQQRGPSETR
mmetsp:Transcript_11015/g.40378  ORF Transcript_11015/g.40378 Transcript_11015/m.40378 type:complete len:320 (+) Transcript_11015:885-1844(+)